MIPGAGIKFDDPDFFLERCKNFVIEKVEECRNLTHILSQHPESPKPAEDAEELSDDNLSDTVSRLSVLFDDESEDAPLLPPEPSEQKSPRFLRPDDGRRRRDSSSPSPTRRKIQAFLAKEYHKLGSKWQEEPEESPREETTGLSTSPSLESLTRQVIGAVLAELERLINDLLILDGTMTLFNEAIRSPDSPPKTRRKSMKIVDSLKNEIFLNYRYLDRTIHGNEEMVKYIDRCIEAIEKEKQGAEASSGELADEASSEASPKHSSEAGPSTVAQEGTTSATGTPKRAKEKSASRGGKKKRISPKIESTASTSKGIDNVGYFPVSTPDSSDDGSSGAVSKQLDECGI